MTTQYSDDIIDAAEAIADAGSTVVFTRTVNSVDEASGNMVPVVTTSTSSAIRVRATFRELAKMEAGGLVLANSIVLVVAAQGMVFDPKQSDPFTFAGTKYTVSFPVDALAPDGTPILYRVIGAA